MKRICVVTGSRAEYGLLFWLMKELLQDADILLQVVVTGGHLVPEQGLTFREIEKDGFSIAAKVDMVLSSDSVVGIAKSVGIAILGLADVLERLQPDILVILGDRYEILATAQTAMLLGIPIAHIHGGELTEGAVDDCIRHAITKMAHLHFTSTEDYRRRVIQMGEEPERVYCVGALGLDAVKNIALFSKEKVETELKFSFRRQNFLITYHPETLLPVKENLWVLDELLSALDTFPEAGLIFTGANADMCGKMINERIQSYVKKEKNRAIFNMSLGQQRYFSVMKQVDVVLGNSSSGIIEAPFFEIPTVNIGDRQKGRILSQSIVNCRGKHKEIVGAIKNAFEIKLQSEKVVQQNLSLYGDGMSAKKIAMILRKPLKREALLRKSFWDQ